MIFITFEIIVSFCVGVFILRSYFPEFGRLLCIAIAFSVTCSILIEVGFELYRNGKDGSWDSDKTYSIEEPVVLWWTPFTVSSSSSISRKCYTKKCVFTNDRKLFWQATSRKAIAFYGTDINITDLPLPRQEDELWALLHEESPKNTPHLTSSHFLSIFNFTSTFSRHSHVPLTTLHLLSLNDITGYRYFVDTEEKNKLRESRAPVLYVQSNCDTLTNRDAFVRELGKHVRIDSFGECERNAELPETLSNPATFDADEFLHFAAKYKFTVAIENAVCEDYITEKLWRSLIVGSVPIYFGSPSVRDWLPNYDSAILISDFDSAVALAAYIRELDQDDDRYEHYLRHKIERVVSNRFLKKVVKSRRWDRYENMVAEFECRLCERLHELELAPSVEGNAAPSVDATHYSCPDPEAVLLPAEKADGYQWSAILKSARCEGKAVFELAAERAPYNRRRLEERTRQLMMDDAC